MNKVKKSLYLLLICSLLGSPAFASFSKQQHSINKYHFSVPPGLEAKVEFWKNVYSKYTTQQAIIHDSKNLGIVYEVVYFGDKKLSRRARDRKLAKVKRKYKKMLRRFAKVKDKSRLSYEELKVYDKVKHGFYQAARNVRAQIGQKDRFKAGLERSGMYMNEIKRIFRQYGLPEELSVLPHVESSFHLGAYSSAGAAGIWQFTRHTGRKFLRVGYDLDERRDPIMATHAAAKLLKMNFEALGDWPLAITAYNHGQQGIRRAQKRYGNNLVQIIKRYKGRTFGFASENFYAEFLAALQVSRNKNKIFPNLNLTPPRQVTAVKLDDYLDIKTAMKYFGMTRREIAKYNPALRPPVLSGQKRIPKGYTFKAPRRQFTDLSVLYAKIPDSLKHRRQVRSKWHTVRRGDTLSGVALRYGTSVRQLKLINNMGRSNRIYRGQVLRLPHREEKKRVPFQLARLDHPKKFYSLKNKNFIKYRVKRNDTLSRIAKKYGTDVRLLARVNNLRNRNNIYPGQHLKIPQAIAVGLPDSSAQLAKKTVSSTEPDSPLMAEKISKKDNRATPSTGKNYPQPKGDSSPQIKLANLKFPAGKMNTNRPAFLPVSFDSDNGDKKVGVITVDFDETLSHYADWAGLSVRELRRRNHLRRWRHIPVNHQIKVPFRRVSPDVFAERRQEYHKAIQEDFFNNYRVSKLLVRNVKKGETLWEICNDIYFIPLWLLSNYNPDRDLHSLKVGEPIVIPIIVPIKPEDA